MKPTLNLFSYELPTFFVIIALAAFAAIGVLQYRIRKEENKAFAYDLVILIMILSFVGSRLMHVLYEEPTYYLENPSLILAFWNGGFVYFGGLLLAVPGAYYFTRKRKEKFWKWADILAPSISISYAVGRMGCFFQGCCFGKECDLPWAIDHRHPTQIYMVLSELLIFVLILVWDKYLRSHSKPTEPSPQGTVFLIWIILNAISRVIIGFFRADDRGYMIAGNLSITQVLAVIFTLATGYLLHKKLKT